MKISGQPMIRATCQEERKIYYVRAAEREKQTFSITKYLREEWRERDGEREI